MGRLSYVHGTLHGDSTQELGSLLFAPALSLMAMRMRKPHSARVKCASGHSWNMHGKSTLK